MSNRRDDSESTRERMAHMPGQEKVVAREATRTWPDVRLACVKELGYAVVYMDYLVTKVRWGEQRERVRVLCLELRVNQERASVEYWLAFQKRIAEEIENLC